MENKNRETVRRFLLILFISLSLAGGLYLTAFAAGNSSNPLLVKALAAYGEKNFKAAASYFEKYSPFSDILKDYVYFWWAVSLKEMNKDEDAISIYNKISHDSPIRKRAVQDLIALYRRKSDWLSAFNLAKEEALLEKNKKLEPALQKQVLELGYLCGKSNLAIDNFKRLIKGFPESQEALEVLEKYGSSYSFKGDEISRAKVYLIHRDFKKALDGVGERTDKESLRLKAEVFFGLKDYNQAISILEGLVDEKDSEEIKLRLGEIYLLSPGEEKGLSFLEELARDKEGTRIACLSLWDLLNYWKGKDNEEKTKLYCERLRQGYRQFSLTDQAIWIEGWMNMAQKNYTEADRVLQAFDTIPRNSRQKMSALYLRAWINLSSDNKEAEKILERLASLYPDTYYGLEALEKISPAPTRKEPGGAESSLKLGDLGKEKDFDRASVLIRLGRDEEATFELESLRKKRYNDINLRYNLTLTYGRSKKFYEAINEAETLIDFFKETGKWPGFLHISERGLLEINFPRYYRDEVEKRAREFRLDENFIYAIIREESRFNEKDVSSSGAIGLMQIIPSTGRWIMEKACLKDIGTEDLFKPDINIFLGSWYLKYLLDRFNGDLLLAVASYNGGPGLIERWVNSLESVDRDIIIEMMPKEETKYYCQKVLFSYHMYKMIYGK